MVPAGLATYLSPSDWPWIFVVGAAMVFAVLGLAMLNQWRQFRVQKPTLTAEDRAQSDALIAALEQRSAAKLKLEFLGPLQHATEPYLSWWHVPVKLVGGVGG